MGEYLSEVIDKKSKNTFTVYMHENKVNKKKYIGITRNHPQKRWCNGWGYRNCVAFFNAIKKYGWDNFEHSILFENLSQDEAEEKEIELIKLYNTHCSKYGYNINIGGYNGVVHTADTKDKIRDKLKGRKIPEELLKQRELNRTDTKQVVCFKKDDIQNIIVFKSISEAARKTKSDISSISKCCRKKLKSLNGFHWMFYDDYKNNGFDFKMLVRAEYTQPNSCVNVRCVDTGEIFKSIREAATVYNIHPTSITKCCRGQRVTCGGLKWEYFNGT